MQLVYENTIDATTHTSLRSYLSQLDVPFEPSQVYNVADDVKLVKPEKRLSEFRTLTDTKLFEFGELIVQEINRRYPHRKFMLYTNDVMHIRYQAGGYFKEHEDYLSVTSNIIEEYSLIVCIDADCEGGETVLHFNKYFKHKSPFSITPGGCILFRKDIPHEGAELISGRKQIITYNVWAIANNDNQVMVINFKNDTRKKVIPIKHIIDHPNDTILKTFLTMTIDDSPIIYYESIHSYDEFSVIDKIYQGCAIGYHEYAKYESVIKYYLFDLRYILIKLIDDNSIVDQLTDYLVTDDLILFGNKARYMEFLDNVKKNQLPYVPFKIIFVEGELSFGGGMTGEKPRSIKMKPIWCTFSEKNNMMLFHKIFHIAEAGNTVSIYDETPIMGGKKLHKIKHRETVNYYNIERADDNEEEYDDGSGVEIDLDTDPLVMNLQTYPLQQSTAEIIELSTGTYMSDIEFIKAGRRNGNKLKYYTLSPHNKITLDPSQYDPIIKKVKEINFYETVIKNLNMLYIHNVQRSNERISNDYCNENVYGNFNLLEIHGFLMFND